MRRIVLAVIASVMLTGVAFAQITLDDFEGGLNGWTDVPSGYTVASLQSGGGAEGSNQWMQLDDPGWTKGHFKSFTGMSAGTFKLTLQYKNGHTALPWPELEIRVLQNATQIATTGKLSTNTPVVVADWTAAETPVFAMVAGDIEVRVVGKSQAGAVACGIDQIKLVPAAQPVTVTATPDQALGISGTTNITANVVGGTGTYTQATFDVGNDSTVEFTDASAPFQFSWNTISSMPAGTSGTVALKITVTDSGSNSGFYVGNYRVQNYGAGLESLVQNGDFSGAWTADGSNQIPAGWVSFNTNTSDYTYWGPADSAEQRVSGNSCLKVANSTGFPGEQTGLERYRLRSTGVVGRYYDVQGACWAKGNFPFLHYVTSDDGGVTWVASGAPLINIPSTTVWEYHIGAIFAQTTALGASPSSLLAVAVHNYTSNSTNFWDDIIFKGAKVLESGVDDWTLY